MTILFKLWIVHPLLVSRTWAKSVRAMIEKHQGHKQSVGSVTCAANEIWEDCGSSTCWEYNCADLLYPSTFQRPCSKDCRQGVYVFVVFFFILKINAKVNTVLHHL